MNKIRIFLVLVLSLFILSCAGMNVQVSKDSVTVLQTAATSTVGYLIAKNNIEYVDDMVTWYNYFKSETKLENVQVAFQDGLTQLSKLISDDPYLQLQVRNAMNLLEINVEGPQTELELGKYQAVVDSFMSGVMAGKMASL